MPSSAKLYLHQALLGLTCFIGAHLAHAQVYPINDYKIKLVEQRFDFKSTDLLESESTLIREALTPKGAEELTKFVSASNTALQKMELVEAYTLKKSGVKIPLAADAMVTQRGMVSAGLGITNPDYALYQWTFPSVDVGDSTVIRLKTTSFKPALPGWQSGEDFLLPVLSYDKVRWTVTAPESLNLNVQSSGPAVEQTTQNGISTWRFELSQRAYALDKNASSARAVFPSIFIGTVADPRDVAKQFALAVQAKATGSDEVTKLAQRITAGLTTDKAKARALYQWVTKEIKYAAIFLANDGFEPHSVSHILDKRYGDCKDHVTLLYALLAAVGIASEPVLINTLPQYQADPFPVLGSFNHTILYLPGLNRYIDPTAADTPFEMLPTSEYGKPIVRSNGQTATAEQTPLVSVAINTTKVSTVLKIAADGSAKGDINVSAVGLDAIAFKTRIRQLNQNPSNPAGQKLLRESGYKGTADLAFSPAAQSPMQQDLTLTIFKIENLLNDADAGAVNANPSINLPVYIAPRIYDYAEHSRRFSYVCSPARIEEDFEISYDPAFQILRVPKDANIAIAGISFTATYQLVSNILRGHRLFQAENQVPECTPAEYLRRKDTMEQIVKHLRTPVLYAQ